VCENQDLRVESRRACPELVERGRLNFTLVQIRLGAPAELISQPRSWFWTGAPCSPQRTWAENGFFQCFHSMHDDSCSWAQSFCPCSKSVGRAVPRLFRPMYPDFLHGAPPTPACAAFIKESRMKFDNPASSTGNPEYAGANMGHPPRL
jgi:hypothetical protein